MNPFEASSAKILLIDIGKYVLANDETVVNHVTHEVIMVISSKIFAVEHLNVFVSYNYTRNICMVYNNTKDGLNIVIAVTTRS